MKQYLDKLFYLMQRDVFAKQAQQLTILGVSGHIGGNLSSNWLAKQIEVSHKV